MSKITVGDLRRAIEGRPDDEPVALAQIIEDDAFGDFHLELTGIGLTADGLVAIEVTASDFDDNDLEPGHFDFDDDEGEDDDS